MRYVTSVFPGRGVDMGRVITPLGNVTARRTGEEPCVTEVAFIYF